MRKLFLVGALIASFVLIGCQSAKRTTDVNSNVKGMVYNSVASNYLPRLTTVSLSELSDGREVLFYRVETYNQSHGMPQYEVFAIPFNDVDEHKALLEKFLEWDNKALSRGDMFTKEIGRAKTYNGYSNYKFHSGNKSSNLLNICFSMTDSSGCYVEGITFDVNNVKNILQDIERIKSGKMKHLDDSIYN